MKKNFWNYLYSFLLSIILVLLIGIFSYLNKYNAHNTKNHFFNNENTLTLSGISGQERPGGEKRIIFLYDLIRQKNEQSQKLFHEFVKERKIEEKKAKVAIIIDDMGYQREIFEQITNFNFPVTISVLPFLPHSRLVAEMGRKKGLNVLLHLPMEPLDANANPGKGAIFTTMNEQEIRAKIIVNLEDLPDIDGVNNHMGSKATENKYVMDIVLKELKKRNLFFVDSMTSPNSIGYKLSKEMGIRTAKRDIFLDNEQNISYIYNQVMALKEFALQNGQAIAIGHPYCTTISVLSEIKSLLESAGIEIVKLEELLE